MEGCIEVFSSKDFLIAQRWHRSELVQSPLRKNYQGFMIHYPWYSYPRSVTNMFIQIPKMNFTLLVMNSIEMGSLWESTTYLKILPILWVKAMFFRSFKSLQRNMAGLCRSKNCKVTRCHTWRSENNSAQHTLLTGSPGLIPRGWNHPRSLKNQNFAALWPKKTDTSEERSIKNILPA